MARSAAKTEKMEGSAITSTLSLAVQANWVSPFSDGGVSMITMSYSVSTRLKASSSLQRSRFVGVGLSYSTTLGLPGNKSITPPDKDSQSLATIALCTLACLGSLKTSAQVSFSSRVAPSAVVASDCGSRSTTKVRSPLDRAAEASPRATVVLPTPPFRELTLRTCTQIGYLFIGRSFEPKPPFQVRNRCFTRFW